MVWEFLLVMEQRAVVRFLTLRKLSARDITAKLEGVYGHEALSLLAVKKWRKRFVNGRITLEDGPGSGRLPRSDLCESLLRLTDESHFISCKRTCQKLRIPKTTCLRVLHEDLWFRKCYLRWVPYSMTGNKAQCRVAFSEALLEVARYAKETNFKHLLTGDESWFYYEYPDDSACAPLRASLPTRTSKEIQTKKCHISIIWSTSGIHNLLALPAGVRYDAEFFCAFVLPDIERTLWDGKHRRTLRSVYLHLDSAPADNIKRSRHEITRTKVSRVVHLAYSPDVAPSNFFLFGHLKGDMVGFTSNSPADILSEIHRPFQEIPKETLVAVYDEWITRLEWITEHKGEYYHIA
jgi:transposase